MTIEFQDDRIRDKYYPRIDIETLYNVEQALGIRFSATEAAYLLGIRSDIFSNYDMRFASQIALLLGARCAKESDPYKDKSNKTADKIYVMETGTYGLTLKDKNIDVQWPERPWFMSFLWNHLKEG